MEIIRSIEWMKQAARAADSTQRVIGFVPTMGALHEGHLSLVRAAKQQCSPVVVSIFVNPKQFAPTEDLEKYPRNFNKDCALLESLGVDFVFAPEANEIYPTNFRTCVRVDGVSEKFEGRIRPGHFQGVCTVVLKLFEIVRPRFAYFGRKDAQQARIIRQMACDLNLDAELVVCPIVRESDGLAMSSRNAYLNADERRAATVLYRSLDAARQRIKNGARAAGEILDAVNSTIASEKLAKLDYAALVDAESFETLDFVRGSCLFLIAVRIGSTRLIDNMFIDGNQGFSVSL
ncbi:MAG TPA: pantoate--beta-alanine ligase [Candidatus Acidoferrales bacterium]|nr:pantoate--beta-alanine ligase [Candidatus Acidoferrales bacterium]